MIVFQIVMIACVVLPRTNSLNRDHVEQIDGPKEESNPVANDNKQTLVLCKQKVKYPDSMSLKLIFLS